MSLWNEIRALASLGLPISISMAAAMLIGVVDTVMIAPLGTVPLAAASITTSVLVLFHTTLYGYISAVNVRMAEAHGKASNQALSVATRTGLITALAAGCAGTGLMLLIRLLLDDIGQPPEVINAVSGYWLSMSLSLIPFTVFYTLKGLFESINVPIIGIFVALGAVALNVPANYLLVHGAGEWPGFGLTGAGLASLLCQSVSVIIGWVIWRRARFTHVARQAVRFNRRELKIQLIEGSKIALGYLCYGGAFAMAALMVGWLGAAALAAQQIVHSIGAVIYMVPLGVSIAVSIRVAQAIGAGESHRLRRIGQSALIIVVSWMAIVMVALASTSELLANALSSDPAVIALATQLFLTFAAMQITDGVQGSMLGAARGMMDNTVPVIITLSSYWAFALPVSYVLGFILGYGSIGIWLGYGAGIAVAAVALTYRFFHTARIRSQGSVFNATDHDEASVAAA